MNDKVKCYYGSYDGRRDGLVVACNQTEAARVVGISLYYFRQYWSDGSWPKGLIPKAGALYTKMGYHKSWTEGVCPLPDDEVKNDPT